MTELKPCPFCGGEAKMHKRLNAPYHAAVCKDTKCSGHNLYVLYWSEAEAIEAWNRRVGEANGKNDQRRSIDR